MRVTPDFAFAIVFSVRTSSFVHARRVIFLANSNLRFSSFGAAFYRRIGATTSEFYGINTTAQL